MRLAGLAIFCLVTSGGAACAQAAAQASPPSDPVAVLLNPGSQPADEPAPAPAPAPSAGRFGGPVGAERAAGAPEPPPSPRDQAYDTRIRSSFAAAESFQAPLDGGWTLSTPGRGELYRLQFVDRRNRLEGAWRDLRRTGAGSVGLIDHVSRSGRGVTLSFAPPGAAAVTLALQGAGDTMSGTLDEAGHSTPVTLRRTGP